MFHKTNSTENFTLCLRNREDIHCFLQLMGYKQFQREIQLTNFDIWYEIIVTNLLKQLYRCKVCNKKFKSKWNLDQHKPVHTGEKKHVCVCGKGYTQKAALYRHCKNNSCAIPQVE